VLDKMLRRWKPVRTQARPHLIPYCAARGIYKCTGSNRSTSTVLYILGHVCWGSTPTEMRLY